MSGIFESIEEKWEKAGLENNYIFYRVMTENPDLCKEVIELLLEKEIERIEIKSEETLQPDPFSKGVRLDVYAKGSSEVFDLEMQTTDSGELPERARYYQSVIDVDVLKHGQIYKELRDSYVIFICMQDVFKKGLAHYEFENRCKSDFSIALNDRSYKHFFIAENCDKILNEKQKEFFDFIVKNSSKSDLSVRLAERVREVKLSTMAKRGFMEYERIREYARRDGFAEGRYAGLQEGREVGLQEGREVGLQEGREVGLQEGRLECFKIVVSNMKSAGKSLEEIQQATGLSEEEIKNCMESK